MRGAIWCWTVVVAVAACGGGDSGADAAAGDAAAGAPDAQVAAVTTVFEPPEPGAGAPWGAIPYPSDLYLDADGFIALQTLPTGEMPNEDYLQFFLERIHEMRGAGVKTNVYFPIDGDVDPDTLAGNVVVVDLDGGLAQIPVDVVWRDDLRLIVAAPRIGSLFLQDRRYAAYVTNAVTGADGVGLAPAPAFAEAIDLQNAPDDPAVAAAQDDLRPLIEALDPAVAATIVTATVFTTDNVTDELKAVRDAAAADPPPASAIEVRTDLDEMFGVQDPGAEPGWSINEYRPQPHGSIAAVVRGTVTLKSFTTDTPGVSGTIAFDGDGAPIQKGVEDVRFVLALPIAASYDQLPVVLFQGTLGGSQIEALYHAELLAARGIAILSIDAPHHASRYVPPSDNLNEITGELGPDGFADNKESATVIRFLQFQASGGYRALDTRIPRDNTRQAVADLCAMIAFVRGGDAGPINTALGAAGLPADLAFDPRGPALAGESVSSMMMTMVLSVEPNADIAMLDVPPAGVVFPTFVHSPQFFGLNAIWFDLFDMNDRIVLDEYSPHSARFDPITNFWGDLLQKGESLPYAPYIATGEVRGDDGPHLVINEAYDDEWIHNQATEWLAGVIGLPRMTTSLAEPPPEPGLRFVVLDELAAPVSANMPGGTTGALLLWHPAQHGFMYVIADEKRFEPGFPPFVELEEPLPVAGFPGEAQTMRAQYFADYFAGGAPIVRDPF